MLISFKEAIANYMLSDAKAIEEIGWFCENFKVFNKFRFYLVSHSFIVLSVLIVAKTLRSGDSNAYVTGPL